MQHGQSTFANSKEGMVFHVVIPVMESPQKLIDTPKVWRRLSNLEAQALQSGHLRKRDILLQIVYGEEVRWHFRICFSLRLGPELHQCLVVTLLDQIPEPWNRV